MSSSSFNPQIQNDPVYSLPHLYISGMNLSVASTTVIAIAPGQARDSSDNIDMPISFPGLQGNVFGIGSSSNQGIVPPILFQGYQQPLFINSAVVGANGIDQGSLGATTEYGIWLIGDSRGYKPVAGLLSLTSNVMPLLPLGYDSMRLLGFTLTDGASHFLAANMLNMAFAKGFYLSPSISVLAGGVSAVFAAIDLSSAIPTTTARDVIAYLLVTFIPAAIGDTVQFRPTGTSVTANLPTISGIAAGVAQQQYIQVIAGVSAGQPKIDYKLTSASDSVSVSVVGYSYTTV